MGRRPKQRWRRHSPRVLVSDLADEKTLLKLGVDPAHPKEVGAFNAQQEHFLDFHRREILRKVS